MTIDALLNHAVTTQAYICEPNVIRRMPELISSLRMEGASRPVLIVADDTTWKVAGTRLRGVLDGSAPVSSGGKEDPDFVFPARPAPEARYERVLELKEWLKRRAGFVVAVGSGTVNDLSKQACGELNRPYAVLATAASMDGYCSQGAAIVRDGLKQVLDCPAPVLIAADPEILAAAPPEMAASGYGDLAAKCSAGLDWILADRLGADRVDELAWRMVFDDLDDRLADADAVGRGDQSAVAGLFAGLAATGFALQYHGDSRPASGTEHQFSHVLEMEGWTHESRHPSHGFKVAVGSLAAVRLHGDIVAALENLPDAGTEEGDAWLAERLAAYPSSREQETEARHLFGGSPGLKMVLDVVTGMRPPEAVLQKRLERLLVRRDGIVADLRAALPDFETFRRRLEAAGAPGNARQLGLTPGKVQTVLKSARLIRGRYGVLDLAYELGILDETVERVGVSI